MSYMRHGYPHYFVNTKKRTHQYVYHSGSHIHGFNGQFSDEDILELIGSITERLDPKFAQILVNDLARRMGRPKLQKAIPIELSSF